MGLLHQRRDQWGQPRLLDLLGHLLQIPLSGLLVLSDLSLLHLDLSDPVRLWGLLRRHPDLLGQPHQ